MESEQTPIHPRGRNKRRNQEMKYAITLAALATLALAGEAQARDQIRIVGSRPYFPSATAVAEQFGKSGGFKTPVVESTGTGGGFKLFCAGVGVEHPDITNASRAIKDSGVATCAQNGVNEITEIKIGYRRHRARQFQGDARRSNLTLKTDLPGAGQAGAGRRQAGRQPVQDLEGHRSGAAEREDRSARPAADLRHARRVRRAGDGGRLRRRSPRSRR